MVGLPEGEAAVRLSAHAVEILSWATDVSLTISLWKSHPTLFPSDFHLSRLDPSILMDALPLALERNPKIFCVHLDPHLQLTHHSVQVAARRASRLKLMKALSSTR